MEEIRQDGFVNFIKYEIYAENFKEKVLSCADM